MLEQIIRHCLEKEPEERFQSARDLGFQLRLARHPSAQTPAPAPTHTHGRYFAAAIAGLALVGTAVGLTWRLTRHETPPAAPILTRLTSDSGLTTDPALSPDGKFLACASDRGGDNLDIWLQQVGKGEALRLTTDPADDREPSFSPDGATIAFRSERDGGGIYVVSTLGGAATKLASHGRRPRFSPDGRWIAYWTGGVGSDFSSSGASRTYVVAATGGVPRRLQPEFAVTRFPVWSPDSKHILFLGDRDPNFAVPEKWDWWVAPLDDGQAVGTGALAAFRKHGLPDVSPPGEWTAEGRVLFTARAGDSRNVWQAAISPTDWRVTNAPQRLTFGAGIEDLPSTAAGGRIAFSNVTANIDVWSLPVDHREGMAAGELRRLTENMSADIQPAISADGRRLVYASNRAGNYDVLTKDLQTGEETAITISPAFESIPMITPDGSEVAYNEYAGEKTKVYVASLGGRSEGVNTVTVCEDCFLAWDWSPNKKHLLYWSKDQKRIGLLDVASREKTIILKHPEYALLRSHFSRDGRWIAFVAIVASERTRLFIAPFQGRSPIAQDTWIGVTNRETSVNVPRWSPDSNSLYFATSLDGYVCLWRQRLDAQTKQPLGEPKPVYHLHGARRSISNVPIPFLEISMARDKIVFPMGERTGNIWMAEWKR
jgi:Tol biopolymer transport system component